MEQTEHLTSGINDAANRSTGSAGSSGQPRP
jgi:hypothetical protein